MRLINTRTLGLEEYYGDRIPKYAILSHVWRDEEVTFQDWQDSDCRTSKLGFQKIQASCHVCQRNSIDYLWVDTNCINKDSSSELSEAINSMFTWYQNSSICFVYLDDFVYESKESLVAFGDSRWFTRGWTLQELLAPKIVQFFDADWVEFGTKQSLLISISKITSIQFQYLIHPESIRLASVAKRMSWVASRITTREEDIAYCLLGIFGINMPLLYGEGSKAFICLQEEIIRHSNDHTIFCWSWPPSMKASETPDWQGCLAPKPATFRDSSDFVPTSPAGDGVLSDFQITNSGLRITLPLLNGLLDSFKLGMLNVKNPAIDKSQIYLVLQAMRGAGFARSRFSNRLLSLPQDWAKAGTPVYVAHERDPNRKISTVVTEGTIRDFYEHREYAILPVNSSQDQISSVRRLDWGWSSSESDIYGAAIALKQDGGTDTWRTRLKVHEHTTAGVLLEVKFTVRITQSQDVPWEVKIQMKCENGRARNVLRASTLNMPISRDYDFTLDGKNGPTLVAKHVGETLEEGTITIPMSKVLK